jgi:hypothetical protein
MIERTRARSRRAAPFAAAAVALALSGCASLRAAFAPPPAGVPGARAGWLEYRLEGLRFEAPADWQRSGSARHLRLEAPDGAARLEVSTPDVPFSDQPLCLSDAEAAIGRAALERARRHPTTFGGARAFTVEGDRAGWHVWAWAACDGGRQYQVFFTARTPAPPAVIEAHRAVAAGARIGGES